MPDPTVGRETAAPEPDSGVRVPPRERRAFLALWLVVTVLLLTRLGDMALWQDEGQVAFLGKTTLAHGVPVAWDGRNLKNDQAYGHLFRESDLVWVTHTWLPMYLAAAGTALGGVRTWAVRLPFVLWAVAAVPLLFLAVRRITGRPRLAWLAVLVMVTNAPFYLYARQANYYPAMYVAGIALWWALLRLGTHPRAWIVWGAAAAVAYHSNGLVFFVLYVALFVALLVSRPGRAQWIAFAKACALTAALTLPFFLFAGVAARRGDLTLRYPGHPEYGPFLFRAFAENGLAIVPWVLTPLALLRHPGAAPPARPGGWSPPPFRAAVVLVVVFALLFPVVSPWAFQRYYCVLFPLGYVLVAAGMDAVWARRWWAGALLFAVHALTSTGFALTWVPLKAWAVARADAPQYTTLLARTQAGLGPRLRVTDMARYLGELTHEFSGPVERLVEYLQTHAEPDDLVLISYPHESLAFYTNLRLCNRLHPDDPLAARFPSYISNAQWPDWVIHRAQYPNLVFDYERFVAEQAPYYERIELDAVDTAWENRPQPDVHRYRTAREGPPLVVWRRRSDAPVDPWHAARAPESGGG